MDEFDLTLKYIKGKDNVLADCFSRLPILRPITGEKGNARIIKKRERSGKFVDFHALHVPQNEEMILEDEVFFNNLTEHEQHADIEDDNEMIECFLNLPSTNEMPNPISLREIKDHQLRDNDLTRLATEVPERFPINLVSNTPLITIKGVDKQYPDDWKIFVPPTLIHDMIKWYHETLGHCGTQKLYNTIRSRFYSPNLSVLCREFKCDKNCQQYKQLGRQFGHLPPRNVLVAPWDEVAVNLIGPRKIKVKN